MKQRAQIALVLLLGWTNDPSLRKRLKSGNTGRVDWQEDAGVAIVPVHFSQGGIKIAAQGARDAAWEALQKPRSRALTQGNAFYADLQQRGHW